MVRQNRQLQSQHKSADFVRETKTAVSFLFRLLENPFHKLKIVIFGMFKMVCKTSTSLNFLVFSSAKKIQKFIMRFL